MMNYYCDICDKTIKRKSKTRHNKSKSHLHMKSYIKRKTHYWRCLLERFLQSYSRVC